MRSGSRRSTHRFGAAEWLWEGRRAGFMHMHVPLPHDTYSYQKISTTATRSFRSTSKQQCRAQSFPSDGSSHRPAFRGCDGIEGTVWIDGVLLDHRLHKAGKVDGEIQRIVLYYNADGSCTYQELRCSDLLTVEEPAGRVQKAQTRRKRSRKLGTIGRPASQFGTKKRGDELAASSFRPVPEKLLKGKKQAHPTSKTKYAEDCPFAAFRFKYRSKDDLKKQYVIPRTPEPESDTEDVIEVKQETDSGISKRCRTHDEESSNVDDDVLEIKTVTLTDKVVIDLTKDSDH
ncbi:hypothetical protein DFJ73DRAFT_847603 [Zopfochytrium polystomum]|nr:hypothetical protein DFJ73DRAFT_847603 [Zopfochytrium polystomum]